MANQAITIKFKTPSEKEGAKVIVSAYCGHREYAFANSLSNEENAKAAVRSFANDMQWEGDFVIGEQSCAVYVALLIPHRYIKARDAVIAVRKAMSQGDLHGNPHSKQWGQQITDLTDGVQPGGFASEYARSI